MTPEQQEHSSGHEGQHNGTGQPWERKAMPPRCPRDARCRASARPDGPGARAMELRKLGPV